jgi:pimeloyl-[acyl-carrier protein] methyl ester esterase
MAENKHPSLQVAAMHGWGRDGRTWDKWRHATEPLGWNWQLGERGYGNLAPHVLAWPEKTAETRRIVIGRSLGPHMVPPDVLAQADIVVLLASFAAFVPPGREGRRARAALAGMAACLEDKARARDMLEYFTKKIAEPQPSDLLPPGPLDGQLDETNRARLRSDLDLLGQTDGLPVGFPQDARVLIVEGEDDRIVQPGARRMLRKELPDADAISFPEVGHALLGCDLIARVVEWVEKTRADT